MVENVKASFTQIVNEIYFMNAHANQAQLKHIEIYARRKKKKKKRMKTDIFSADLWYQTIVILMLVFGVLYVYCIFGMMVRMVELGFIAMHENCLNRQVKNKVDSFSSFICICVSWHTYTYTQTRWFIAISFIYFDKIRENSLSLSLSTIQHQFYCEHEKSKQQIHHFAHSQWQR